MNITNNYKHNNINGHKREKSKDTIKIINEDYNNSLVNFSSNKKSNY